MRRRIAGYRPLVRLELVLVPAVVLAMLGLVFAAAVCLATGAAVVLAQLLLP